MVLSSISRALWFNNLGLARKLIDYSASAKDLIFIGDSQVKAFSYKAFETIFGDFFNMYHSSQVQQIQKQMAKKAVKKSLSNTSRPDAGQISNHSQPDMQNHALKEKKKRGQRKDGVGRGNLCLKSFHV